MSPQAAHPAPAAVHPGRPAPGSPYHPPMTTPDLSALLDRDRANAELFDLLRLPSVSADPTRTADMAATEIGRAHV